jgi:cytochrome P450
MTAETEIAYNPFDPEFRVNPYPVLKRLREQAPVYRSPLGFIALSRYEDCVAMLRSPHASSDSRKTPGWRDRVIAEGFDPDKLLAESNPPFLFLDPPDHTRLRGLVSKAFTPRVVEGLRPRIEEIVEELLDAAEERGRFDAIEDFAYPLPVRIISEMLGVPPEDEAKFRGWSAELARSLDPDFALPPEVIQRRQQAGEALAAFMGDLIARRRVEPRDDLVSGLIAAEEEGHKLTEAELVTTCILLLIAGHETTVNLIGNGINALLRNRDQFELLRAEPSLIKSAVEELLRYDAPVQLTGRDALVDIELSDTTVRAGEMCVLLLSGANRDPAQFSDPDRLDIRREDNRHLAFGMGIHFCLGAPLARVEGQAAIGELVRRFPAARIADDTPRYKENITLRGLAALNITLT